MPIEYTSDVPDKLAERLEVSREARRFRRRAVLTNGNNRWELVCCTVEGFLPGENLPEPVSTRRYRQAVLYEDVLTGEECLDFAREIQEGHARFGDLDLQRGQNAQWNTERLPVNNDYMARAGYVISLHFAQHGGRAFVNTLLAPDQPYYPDVDEAARDWLPFRVYHGHSDARNDQIVFLLPETRAFIAAAVFSEQGTLDVTVAGTEVGSLSLLIKGAYWEGRSIRQLAATVKDSKGVLVVPGDANRLEYYLIDRAGTVYDFHREDRLFGQSPRALGSARRTLEDQVRRACQNGEGERVEFKPFIDPLDKLARNAEASKRIKENTKLRELIETVAAFANTEGGHIYLGVNDDCTVPGIDQPLREWAKAALDEAAISRYLGVLKSKIKELVHGEVVLNLSYVEIDGMLVVIIEVPPAAQEPVALRQEYHLYVRTGASNRKAPPEQWRSILKRGGDAHGPFDV